MLIPLSVADLDRKFIFAFRPVRYELLARRYVEQPLNVKYEIHFRPADYAPTVGFRVEHLMRGYPDKISQRSYVLTSHREVWDTLIHRAPSPEAHKKLLRKIERKLIAELMKDPDAANG